MADEPNQTQSTETPKEPVQGNSPEARNPDGSLKETPPIATQSSEQTKTEEQPKKSDTEVKTDGKKEEPKAGAPETYAAFKAPEGYELNEEVLAKATPIFKELGLSQDAAQKLVDFYGEAAAKAEDAPYAAYETMREGWRKDIIADPTLGNGKDGLKPEVQSAFKAAIDSLGPTEAAEFRKAMDATGAGDHPAFIRAFYNFAQRLGTSEGTLVTGSGPATTGQTRTGRARPTPAQALYPNHPSSAG